MIKKEKKKKTSDLQTNNNYTYIHFIQSPAFFSFPAPLALFLTTLSCATHEHILFRSHSRSALLRASGDVHCSLDKGSLLLTSSLSPFSPLRSFPCPYLPAQHCAPRGLLQGSCDAARRADDSYAYLSQSQAAMYAVTRTIRWRQRENAARNSAGNTSTAASARRCKRLTVSQTPAGAIWSALPVPVGHLPTLGKA